MLKYNIVTVLKKILDLSASNTKPNRDMTFISSKLLVNLTAHGLSLKAASKKETNLSNR